MRNDYNTALKGQKEHRQGCSEAKPLQDRRNNEVPKARKSFLSPLWGLSSRHSITGISLRFIPACSLWLLQSLLFLTLFTACRQEDDKIEIVPARHWVEKKVAVVAPLGDAATKARLERTADWFLQNFREAQMHDTLAIDLKIEWYDELSADLTALSETLAADSTVVAVIGPFANERVAAFAPACMKTQKPLIAPTATSEDIIRRYAVTTNGLSTNDKPFLWSLTASDVELTSLLMSDYAAICQSYTTEQPNAIVFAIDNLYGKTFSDWAPFFAQDYGIEMLENQTFTTANDIYKHMAEMSDESDVGDAFDLASASFIAVETTKMLYDIARVRRQLIIEYYGTPMFASDDPFAAENDDYWQLLNSIYRTYFAFSGLSEESLEALGPDGPKMLQGYQGFSPYADPTTGFELSYETRFGVLPTFAECKFYDALMLAAFAACYVEHGVNGVNGAYGANGAYETHESHETHTAMNQAIVTITNTANASMGGPAWNATPMQVYLSAMEGGQLYRFSGASGDISFDRDTYTAATATTYVHWQIMDGHIYHRSYFGSKGGARTTEASAAWLYLYNENRASDDFMQQAGGGTDNHFAYPAMTDQYAVLVQGSDGFVNYRHQADVLSIYQSLRRGGYPDDHIILILDRAMAADPQNPEPGVVRTSPSGPDLLGGTTTGSGIGAAVVDYDNADLTAADVADILAGRQSDRLPAVVPQGEGHNVLFYWSGHGRSTSRGGANEFAWRDTSAGRGFSARLLRQTAEQMQFRKFLVVAEPCYAECVIRNVDGLPGVLAMSGANANEQSWADCWSNDAKVWMCDRFSQNLVSCLSANPDTSFRDLFLYCAQHTLGSHARIVNAANFGNLYVTGPAEFIRYITNKPKS